MTVQAEVAVLAGNAKQHRPRGLEMKKKAEKRTMGGGGLNKNMQLKVSVGRLKAILPARTIQLSVPLQPFESGCHCCTLAK